MTPLQQKQLRNMIVFLLLVVFAWLIFAPNLGVWSLYSQKRQIQSLRVQKEKLERENENLRKDVDRLETDLEYFEKFAREKGLLGKDEIVIDFGENSK